VRARSLVLVSLLSFGVAAFAVRTRARALEVNAREMGAALGRAVAAMPGGERPIPASSVPAAQQAVPSASVGEPCGPTLRTAHARRGKAKSREGKPSRAIFVDARTVRALAARGLRVLPSSRSVPANGERPAGIELARASGLGIGLRDGDVLTDVEGAPVTTQDQAFARVLVLLARRDRTISGRLFRRGEPWTIVVEVPYDIR
jgi:hypothetical protein